MTETGILYISISCIIITIIICATVIFNNWYEDWRKAHIETLKKYVDFQYKIYRDRPEMESIFMKEFNKIIKEIKQIVDRL